MKTSESIKNLSVALLKAQKNIGAATKGSKNPFFKSTYADLGSVMEACKDALNNEGISVLQPVTSTEQGDYVETILLHESGEHISSSMKLVLSKQDMQSYGSAVSYARRYSLQSLVFIPAEDDDGEKSMTRAKPPASTVGVTLAPSTQIGSITLPVTGPVDSTTSGTLTFSVPPTSLTTGTVQASPEPTKSRTSFRKATPPVVETVASITAVVKPSLNF